MGFRFLHPLRDLIDGALTYLFRDDFTTADASPLADPRTAEPGPGSLDITQSAGTVETTGGQIEVTGATSSYNDPSFWSADSYARASGLTLFAKHVPSGNTISAYAFNSAASNPHAATGRWMFSGGVLRPQGVNTDSIAASATKETALVCLSTGYLFFTKDSGDWTLRWVNTDGTADPLYIGYGNYSAVKMAFDYFYLAQLLAPFNADASFLTDSNAAPVQGNTFTHEADFVASVVLDYAAAEQSIIYIRQQDGSNNWIIETAASGIAYLKENVSGSPTVRDTKVGAFVAGNTYTLTIVASGTTIRVFKDGTEILTYTSATNFSSETSGTFVKVGVSCSFSDLYVYPRIQGAALAAALDSFIP